jgi:hypothetical protein
MVVDVDIGRVASLGGEKNLPFGTSQILVGNANSRLGERGGMKKVSQLTVVLDLPSQLSNAYFYSPVSFLKSAWIF